MENQNVLVLDERLTQATGTAEREAAFEMLCDLPGEGGRSVGADKSYETADSLRNTGSQAASKNYRFCHCARPDEPSVSFGSSW